MPPQGQHQHSNYQNWTAGLLYSSQYLGAVVYQ